MLRRFPIPRLCQLLPPQPYAGPYLCVPFNRGGRRTCPVAAGGRGQRLQAEQRALGVGCWVPRRALPLRALARVGEVSGPLSWLPTVSMTHSPFGWPWKAPARLREHSGRAILELGGDVGTREEPSNQHWRSKAAAGLGAGGGGSGESLQAAMTSTRVRYWEPGRGGQTWVWPKLAEVGWVW